jgi:hypothetical protein
MAGVTWAIRLSPCLPFAFCKFLDTGHWIGIYLLAIFMVTNGKTK